MAAIARGRRHAAETINLINPNPNPNPSPNPNPNPNPNPKVTLTLTKRAPRRHWGLHRAHCGRAVLPEKERALRGLVGSVISIALSTVAALYILRYVQLLLK